MVNEYDTVAVVASLASTVAGPAGQVAEAERPLGPVEDLGLADPHSTDRVRSTAPDQVPVTLTTPPLVVTG